MLSRKMMTRDIKPVLAIFYDFNESLAVLEL